MREETEEELEISPLALRTLLLGVQGMETWAQYVRAVSGGHLDLPACPPPSTAAAEQLLGPRGRKGLCSRRENTRRAAADGPHPEGSKGSCMEVVLAVSVPYLRIPCMTHGRSACGNCFPPSVMWVPEPRPSILAARAFTYWAISPAPQILRIYLFLFICMYVCVSLGM